MVFATCLDDQANRDTYFAEHIPDTGMGTPIAKRGMRLPVLFVAGQDSEFWPASPAAACAVLAPMGDSIVLAADGHAANIEQPKAFNEALLGFQHAG